MNNDQYYYTYKQEELLKWMSLIVIIILMTILTVYVYLDMNKNQISIEKQHQECGQYDGTMVYTSEQKYRCFQKEIILNNYYTEYTQ